MGDTTVAAPAEACPVILFDTDGDLHLDVGDGQAVQRFVVCSKTLSRASKVFKAMLYGDFLESKSINREGDWVVALPADDPSSLATLFYIVHGIFSKVPDAVTRDELFHITVLTDKYYMTEVLRPWVRAWINPLASDSRPIGQESDAVLLWIAWELGHLKLFEKTLSHLQETCIIDDWGNVKDRHGVRLGDKDHIQALDIIDGEGGLAATRITRIQSLLLVMTEMIEGLGDDSLMAPSEKGCYTRDYPSIIPIRLHTETCKTWYLGSLVRALAKQNYYPIPPPTGIRVSVQDVRKNLEVVCEKIQPGPWGATCSPKRELVLTMVKVKRYTKLTSAQTKHLQEQAAKTGL